MSITDADPIEIKNIRNLFPSFPDEPTVNQFYNEKQVSAYRTLGYHIGSRFCNELFPWFKDPKSDAADITTASEPAKPDGVDVFSHQLNARAPRDTANEVAPVAQPLFDVLKDRLLTHIDWHATKSTPTKRKTYSAKRFGQTADLHFRRFRSRQLPFTPAVVAHADLPIGGLKDTN
jgi:hypothetical protein